MRGGGGPGTVSGQTHAVPVLLSPGQGSQSAGLLAPWLDLSGARESIGRWSALTDLDLLELGTTAPAEVVRRTEVAQPLLTALALLSGRSILDGEHPDLVCGHSVGELSAAALAGILTDDEAVQLAAVRGHLMAQACDVAPTGMAAVLGAAPSEEQVRAAGLEIATVNAPGQVVVGGPLEAIEAFAPAGARVRRLAVAGAFHTAAMQPAVNGLTEAVAALKPASAVCPVVANADGALVTGGRELLDRFVLQLTNPVRFDLCLAALPELPVVELAPAGTLTGLVKRARPDLGVTGVGVPVSA